MNVREQPKNLELEMNVLGAMMLEPACVSLVVSMLHEDVFYLDLHKVVYRAIISLYDESQPTDISMVVERIKRMGLLKDNISPYDVMVLTNNVVSSANVEAHARIIQQYFLQRESIRLGGEMANKGYTDDPFDTLNTCSAEILKLQEQALKGHQKTISDYVVMVNKERDAILQNGTIGISSGLNSLDEVISGLVAPDLIIIAARPGMGKTALALTIAHHVSVHEGLSVGIFSLEMSALQLVTRMESINSGILHEQIRKNDLSETQRHYLAITDAAIARSPLFIDETPGLNIRELRTKANIMKRKHNVRLIIVDYLQLMSGIDERGKSRENVISEISRGLKIIAKELNIPIIALSQLSRAVESRPDKMPQLSDLRESGSIEQDADEVIFLMRPEYYEMTEWVEIGSGNYNPDGLVITKIAKNRHGSPKNIPLYFNGPTMKYLDHHPNESGYKPIPKSFSEPSEKTPF